MTATPPRISTIDRQLAWSQLAASMFEDAAAEPVVFDGYRLLGVLGRGAMGAVYLAHDPTLEREVAIKLVDSGDRAQTLQEARTLARVAHPGVVAIHHVGHVGDAQGMVYIVMERLRGEDLRSWQAGRAWPQIVAMYVALARALGCAHGHGVVHRDFKPDNVRIDEHGRGRILDWGLAVASGHDADASGTPAYRAPEQLAGVPADPRMDQYAWAVALREALSQPSCTSVPAQIYAVVERAAALQPDARWPSMDALADALEQATPASVEQRARALLLDKLDATWLDTLLRPLRDGRVALQPAMCSANQPAADVTLEALDRALERAGVVVIHGGPGSGKTTVLLELAARALARAREHPSAPMPVILNLSSWSMWPSDTLDEWLVDAIGLEYQIPRALARRWLDEGALLLLLDGLDEVVALRQASCVEAIAALRADHLVGLALASRRVDAEDELASLRATLTVELQPLSPEALADALAGDDRAKLRALIDRAPALGKLLVTPLLVDLALRCVDELEPSVAADEHAFSRELLRRFFARQLAPLEPSARELLRARLVSLARLLTREGASELWLERMQPSWLARPRQSIVHGIVSVVLVAVLLGMIVAATLIPAAGVRVGLESAVLAGPLLALFVGLRAGVGWIQPIERLSWSWSRLRANAGQTLKQALGLAAALSVVATVVWGVGQTLMFALAIAISNFLGYALLFALTLGVLGGLDAKLVAGRSRINAGMWASARNMILVWAMVTTLLCVPLMTLAWFGESIASPPPDTQLDVEAITRWRAEPRRFFALVGLCAASTLGLVAGLLRGGFAPVQHAVLRAMLALAGELPLRVGRLLAQGRACGLLRRVGGGHAFVHGALQAELAERDPA